MIARKSTVSIFLKPASGVLNPGVRPLKVVGLPRARFNPAKKVLDEKAFVKSLVATISNAAAELAGGASK